MRHRDKPQSGVRRRKATQPSLRIVIAVADTDRKVQRSYVVVNTGTPEHRPPVHLLPRDDVDCRQVRVRGSQSVPVGDGDREDTGDTAGEADHPTVGRAKCGPRISRNVDAPMTSVAADGRKAAHHFTGERSNQARAQA